MSRSLHWAWQLTSLCLWALLLGGSTWLYGQLSFQESFADDPVQANRFVRETAGTESRFVYDPTTRALQAVLDADSSPAYYLSTSLGDLTDTNDFSFSFVFRVTEVDVRAEPAAFIGLMTTTHVGAFGDGLTLGLSISGGAVVANAVIDQGGEAYSGGSLPVSLQREYLAVARYLAANRQFRVDLFSATNRAIALGHSETSLPIGRRLRIDRLGLQNSGARLNDLTSGSISLTIDDFSIPSRGPTTIAISDASVLEGHAGNTQAVFRVSLSAPSDVPVSVAYSTVSGTASSGIDFTPVSGVLNFPVGEVLQEVRVLVIGDRQVEPVETFTVLLSNSAGGGIAKAEGKGTILDDDRPLVFLEDKQQEEPISGRSKMEFTVRLGEASTAPVTVDYSITPITAAAGVDYVPTNGTVRFSPGTLTQPIVVELLADDIDELDETFLVRLSNPSNANLAVTNAVGAVIDSTAAPLISVQPATVAEGDQGDRIAPFEVRLSHPSSKTVIVTYATRDGTATSGPTNDFEAVSGSLVFAPFSIAPRRIEVPIHGDFLYELSEQFTLRLTAAQNAMIAQSEVIGDILNDDAVPVVKASDLAIPEGDQGSRLVRVPVDLSHPSSFPITVSYLTQDGTAKAGEDYQSKQGSLLFSPGTTHQELTIEVFGDTAIESDETFAIAFSNPPGSDLARSEILVTIRNDEFVTVSIQDASRPEGDGGVSAMDFVVSLSKPSSSQVLVAYATLEGTAKIGSDFVAKSGLLIFAPSEVRKVVSIPIIGDVVDEPAETFYVKLEQPIQATIGEGLAIGTIQNDDPPGATVVGNQVREGDTGATNLTFTVALTSPSAKPISMKFTTKDGLAADGTDYGGTNGVLVFSPGQMVRTLQVPVVGDSIYETNETVFLILSNPTNAVVLSALGVGEIINDDPLPSVQVTHAVVQEGRCSKFTFTLSRPSAFPAVINYCITNPTAPLTATNIHTPCGAQCCQLTFAPGVTQESIDICLDEDDRDGGGDGFGFGFDWGGGGRGGGGFLDIEVEDNDPPAITALDSGLLEGDAGTNSLIFPVLLSSSSDQAISVDFRTVGVGAQAGIDFLSVTGSVAFPPGLRTQFVRVPILGDTTFETNDTLVLLLTNSVHASIAGGMAVGTITNDDSLPVLVLGDARGFEGDEGVSELRFPVHLSSLSDFETLIAYTTAEGTASALDFVPAGDVVRLAPGILDAFIVLQVRGDRFDESDESFYVRLLSVSGASSQADQVTGTILDDDPPDVMINDALVIEGNSGLTNLLFQISLTSTSSVPISVRYFTVDGTALAGEDFLGTTNTLSFAPGELSRSVSIQIKGDRFAEPHEAFQLCLTNPVNARLLVSHAAGSILDDDQPIACVRDFTIEENPIGSTQAVCRVELSFPSTEVVSVNLTTESDTAEEGIDYVGLSRLLLFAPGETNQTVTLEIRNDVAAESPERLHICLSNPVHAHVCDGCGTGTIVDGSLKSRITVKSSFVEERDFDVVNLVFVAELSQVRRESVSFSFATTDTAGSAAPFQDYVPVSGRVTIPAGSNSRTFTVSVLPDRIFEADETVVVSLSNPSVNATLDMDQVVGDIHDNDPSPKVLVQDAIVREGDQGRGQAIFKIRLSSPVSEPIQLGFSTRDGTARGGSDYVLTNGVITLEANQVSTSVPVTIFGDSDDEPDEDFELVVTVVAGVDSQVVKGVGYIVSDDGISLSAGDHVDIEGNTGLQVLSFPVFLSKAPSTPIVVFFRTTNLTAVAGRDYVETNGTLVFAAGQTNQTLEVGLVGDVVDELDETFGLILTGSDRARIERPLGIGTILDDDQPCLSIANAVVIDSGVGTNLVFTLRLSSLSDRDVSVSYFTSNATAAAGIDYAQVRSNLVIPANHLLADITVAIKPNTQDETNEFFYVQLYGAVGAILCDPLATGTIVNPILTNEPPQITLVQPSADLCLYAPTNVQLIALASDDGTLEKVEFFADGNSLGEIITPPFVLTWSNTVPGAYRLTAKATDNLGLATTSSPVALVARPLPAVAIGDGTIVENDGGTNFLAVTLRLSAPSCLPVSVRLQTKDASAKEGVDYVPLNRWVTFLPGSTNLEVAVGVLGDLLDEDDETFLLEVVALSNAVPDRIEGRALVQDNDPEPRLVIPDRSILEGDSDPRSIDLSVMLSAPSGREVNFKLSTVGGTATPDLDYRRVTDLPIRFVPGETNQRVPFIVLGDRFDEPDETVGLRVGQPSHVELPFGLPLVTIQDNDAEPELQIAPVQILEGNQGYSPMRFQVLLSAPSQNVVIFDAFTVQGTAESGRDFVSLGATSFEIPAGVTNKVIEVQIIGDRRDEDNELFSLQISNIIHALPDSARGVGTIVNDDLPPEVIVENKRIKEGDAGILDVEVSVGLRDPSEKEVTIEVSTQDATALAGLDYVARQSQRITFPKFSTNVLFVVGVMGDTAVETDEAFTITATGVHNALPRATSGTVTVLNDDVPSNLAPEVRITQPANGREFPLSSEVLLSVEADDRDGAVVELTVIIDGSPVAVVNTNRFSGTWIPDQEGVVTLSARAIDDRGASTTSDPTVVHIKKPTAVAVIEGGRKDDLAAVEAYLQQMGVGFNRFTPESLNCAALEGYELVIWHDLGVDQFPILERQVEIARCLETHSVASYFIGERLADSGVQLPYDLWSDWYVRTLHLEPFPQDEVSGFLRLAQRPGEERRVLFGPYGVVPAFPFISRFRHVVAPHEQDEFPLGDLGRSSGLVLTAPSTEPGARKVTQYFPVWAGGMGCGQLEREMIFKNAVSWLRKSPLADMGPDLTLNLTATHSNPAVGDPVILDITVENRGASVARGVVLGDFLHQGLQVRNISVSQGSFDLKCNEVLVRLGDLAPNHMAMAQIEVVPLVAGDIENWGTVISTQPEADVSSNFARVQLQVQGQTKPFLRIHYLSSETLLIELNLEPGRAYRLEASNNLTDFTTVTAGETQFLPTSILRNPADVAGYYRVVVD